MTRQEAREVLQAFQSKYIGSGHPDVAEACRILKRHISVRQFLSASTKELIKHEVLTFRTKK